VSSATWRTVQPAPSRALLLSIRLTSSHEAALLPAAVITVNPRHWLNQDGSLPDEPRLRKQALRVAQCVEYAGPLKRGHARETLIACRRKLDRKACPGLLWVLKQEDDAIHAYCVVCKSDEYLIYEWENTDWANGPMEAIDVATMAREQGKQQRQPTADDRDALVHRALELVGSTLGPEQLKRLVRESDHPTAVTQAILASVRGAPQQSALERLMPVVMDVWNSTPRNELDGRSATEMAGSARTTNMRSAPRAGRNDPCPCGSGRKYKKCCIHAAPN
jgi:hypothetical protein